MFCCVRKPWVWVSKALTRFNVASSTPNQKLSLRSWYEPVVRNLMGGRKTTEKKFKCVLNPNFYRNGLLPVAAVAWYWITYLLPALPAKLQLRISFSATLRIIFMRKTKKYSSQPVFWYLKYWHGVFPLYILKRIVFCHFKEETGMCKLYVNALKNPLKVLDLNWRSQIVEEV